MDGVDLVARYYDALNRHDLETLDALVSADLVYHGPWGTVSWDSLKQRLVAYRDSFPDLSHSIGDRSTDGDRVVVRTVTAGTHLGSFLGHPASGRRFSAEARTEYRLASDRIEEIWEAFDTGGMLGQLDLAGADQSGDDGVKVVPSRAYRPPPGPARAVPLGTIRAAPLDFLQDLVRSFGDHVRYICDGRETVLLNEPRAVRHVLHDNASNYTKQGTPDLMLLEPMLGDGLLTAAGPVWKRDRQWLHPAFTRRRLENSVPVMVAATRDMTARWAARAEPAAPLDMVQEFSRLTLEIAAQVLYSSDVTARSQLFGAAMDVLNESTGRAHADDGERRRFGMALEEVRGTVWRLVLARRFLGTGPQDVLDSLISGQREHGDSDRHLVDQAVTLLLAGHETTAKALSWCVALLDRHDEVRARLVSELDGVLGGRPVARTDLDRLPFLRAVVTETLRLYPPVWLLTRTALADDEVAGYAVPGGGLVAMCPYLLHRHPGHWPRPEEFDPDRFLRAEAASHTYRYLPFGHGERHCIGKYFAMLEMPVVLATLYAEVVPVVTVEDALETEALVTLRPRRGVPATPTRRPEPSS